MSDWEVLGLPPTASLSDLKRRFQELALESHPDQGGDAARFDAIRQAYNRLKAELEQPRLCPKCQGKGRLTINRAFLTVTINCDMCEGEGEITP